MATPFCVVYVTAPKGAPAKKISRRIIQERAAACVNIVPGIESVYWWKGKPETGVEALLIIKTPKAKFKKLAALVRKIHPYTVPEIIALPIVDGHKPYLNWIKQECR